MSGLFPSTAKTFTLVGRRKLSTSSGRLADQHFRLVVVGAGAGGCALTNKFANKLGKGQVAVIDPATTHYYQPLWTLVGGGLKSFSESGRPMESLLPASASWIREGVSSFSPSENSLVVEGGDKITYDYLVVALGIKLRYEKIKGLPEAFETPGVGSNYSPLYVEKTAKAIKEFKSGGDAVFTFPASPVKCAGAPQKIMYIAEETFRLSGRSANIQYYSALPVIFGVKKYADALWEVVRGRNINVNLRHNLIEVRPDSNEAIFENLDTNEKVVQHYDLLHVTPPMSTPAPLNTNKQLADAAGFLEVNKETLQHVRYPNIFGIGDCTSVPTAKTAAAVAAQVGILRRNLGAALEGKEVVAKYDGYTSCPLVTGQKSCILAEFDMQAPPQPLETFPFNQAKERWSMYQLKANILPTMYWIGMKGWWEGPGPFRKAMRLGLSK